MNTKTFEISYSNIEDAVASFLIATSTINDDQEIIEIDMPLKTNKQGIVKVTVSTVSLHKKKTHEVS